jgi:membrane protease YdiL (CAAX protease family)
METSRHHAGRQQGSVPQNVPWRMVDALAIVLAYLLFQVLLAGGLGVGPYDPALLGVKAASDVMAVLAACTLLRMLGSARNDGRPVSVLLGLRAPVPGWEGRALRALLAGGIAYGAALWAVGRALAALGVRPEDVPVQAVAALVGEASSARVVAVAVAVGVLVAPVGEELLYRVVLYLPLRDRVGPVAAAVVVGVVFAMLHGHAPGLGPFFVLSVLFTGLFEATGSIWVPIAVHGAYNAANIALLRVAWGPPGGA